ncbi:MAG: nucleotidyltransferase family protein [Acidobacteriia bacterium]|nr:nucleotidyltransferase family protein [Terriglobia bacterium]
MSEEQTWERRFKDAVATVRQGDFDAIKEALESLGFTFEETTDPNHWMYYHTKLKGDPIFQYPRNLYRPHGSRRSTDRVSNRDQSQAKQMIQALRAVAGASHPSGDEL